MNQTFKRKVANFVHLARDPGKLVLYTLVKLSCLRVKKKYINGKLFYSYQGQLYPDYLKQGNACSYIVNVAQKYCRGVGIDVGPGNWPFPGAMLVENDPHQSAYNLENILDHSLDYVFSSHCLEHLEYWEKALTLWIRKLRTGGVIFLYLPHDSMKLWLPGAPWVAYDHKWQPRIEILVPFLKGIGMEIIDYAPQRDDYWSFYIAARRPQI